MSNPLYSNELRKDVYLLAEAVLRGDASTEDVDRLDVLLKVNPTASEYYVEYILQSVQLGVWAAALGDSQSSSSPSQPSIESAEEGAAFQPANGADMPTKDVSLPSATVSTLSADRLICGLDAFAPRPLKSESSRWRWFVSGAMSALAIASLLLFALPSPKPVTELQPMRETSLASPAVALLTVDNGCDWGNDSPLLHTVGGAVNPGESLTIYEGIAEFRLGSDVRLSVEGPASLVIGSPTTFVLLHGKVTVNVPRTAADFKCIAAGCQFTASDTEFGLWQEGSKLGVHVFTGEVRAAAPFVAANQEQVTESRSGEIIATGESVFSHASITAGHALSLVIHGEELKMANMGEKAAPEMFATKLSMSDVLPISQTYVRAVQADRPIGYWRFNSMTGGVVDNEVKGSSKLKSVGSVGLSGNALNQAAEFHPGAECCLLSDRSLDALASGDYSIEAWVKPSHMHRGRLLTLASGEGDQLCMTSLELQPPLNSRFRGASSSLKPNSGLFAPGTIRFVHHNPLSGKPGYDTSCFSQDRYHIRRWQHLVAVKQGSEMRMYLDGHLAATGIEHTTLSPGVQLRLGSDVVNHGRNFVGQLDEVALYDRALSVEEIRRHYTVIDWSPNSRRLDRRDDI